MPSRDLTAELLALPLAERIDLAQVLWQSIDEGLIVEGQDEIIAQAGRRDEEMTSGAASGRTHEEVMEAARRAIGCD